MDVGLNLHVEFTLEEAEKLFPVDLGIPYFVREEKYLEVGSHEK